MLVTHLCSTTLVVSSSFLQDDRRIEEAIDFSWTFCCLRQAFYGYRHKSDEQEGLYSSIRLLLCVDVVGGWQENRYL